MDLPTHYPSKSKGLTPIAEMAPPHLARTVAMLKRDGGDPLMIAAMDARIAELDAMPDDAARIAATSGVAPIGHNRPPEPVEPVTTAPAVTADLFEAIRVHIDDLYTEAKNWADGVEIANGAQAAEVDRLIDAFKDAIKIAEGAQDAEIDPLKKRIKAVRERYYPLIGETKKITGTAIRAKNALLAVKTKWGDKLRAAQAAQAAALRAEALAAAQQAAAAAQAAPDNLETRESVEDLIQAARAGLKEAAAVEKAKPTGFRTVWVTEIADNRTAILTMMKAHPDQFLSLALYLAKADVRDGRRSLEGFTITETKIAV